MKSEGKYIDIMQNYRGKNILLTGATGFVGKVLLEKVLRTLPVDKVFVLIRDSTTSTSLNKYQKLMASEAFAALQKSHKGQYEDWFRQHVIPIKVDLTASTLNLSKADRLRIRDDVDFYWHLAASVDFNAELKENYLTNVVGTLGLYELAKSSLKPSRFIYISTAYVNSNKVSGMIPESLTPKNFEDPEALARAIKANQRINVADFGHPNSYTFTKALAEDLLFRRLIPRAAISIVRPTCICASYRDPFPGWIDSISAASAPLVLVGYGIIAKMSGRDHNVGDIIPVDLVANAIILATLSTSQRSFQISHVASSHLNPLTWGDHSRYTAPVLVKYPIVPLSEPPKFSMSPSKQQIFTEIKLKYEYPKRILHYLQKLSGKRFAAKWILQLDKAAKSSKQVNELFSHFTLNEWIFRTESLQNMRNRLNGLDRCVFEISPKPIVWPNYLEAHVKGISRHIRQLESNRRHRNKVKMSV